MVIGAIGMQIASMNISARHLIYLHIHITITGNNTRTVGRIIANIPIHIPQAKTIQSVRFFRISSSKNISQTIPAEKNESSNNRDS